MEWRNIQFVKIMSVVIILLEVLILSSGKWSWSIELMVISLFNSLSLAACCCCPVDEFSVNGIKQMFGDDFRPVPLLVTHDFAVFCKELSAIAGGVASAYELIQ